VRLVKPTAAGAEKAPAAATAEDSTPADGQEVPAGVAESRAREARRAEVVPRLLVEGNSRDRATLYADAFIEYETATRNINENGLVTLHPRTMNPLENPYIRIRDKALDKLSKMRGVKVGNLWG